MADKSLKNKAISIKGKDYVPVAERVLYFNQEYPQGSIQTQLVSEPKDEVVIIKATVFPEASQRSFTGYSQAKWGDGMVNKTAALENAETSAVGRALAMMGIGVIESIASADEVNKTTYTPRSETQVSEEPSVKQMILLKGLISQSHSFFENETDYEAFKEKMLGDATSKAKASNIIKQLTERLEAKKTETE